MTQPGQARRPVQNGPRMLRGRSLTRLNRTTSNRRFAMPTVRTVAWCVLAWIAWPTVVAADSLTSGSWTFFFDPGFAAQTSVPPSTPQVADAFINFTGNNPEASTLTTGT